MKQKMNQKEISILGLFWDVLVAKFSDRYTNGKISQAGMVCTDRERAGKIVFPARSLPIGQSNNSQRQWADLPGLVCS